MENLQEMKQWLEENGKALRALKLDIKNAMRNGKYAGSNQWKLECDKKEYRHRHIAYSMARGKTYEQIEIKTPRASDLHWTYINDMIEAMKPQLEEAS